MQRDPEAEVSTPFLAIDSVRSMSVPVLHPPQPPTSLLTVIPTWVKTGSAGCDD